jgi:hypothetical protein
MKFFDIEDDFCKSTSAYSEALILKLIRVKFCDAAILDDRTAGAKVI